MFYMTVIYHCISVESCHAASKVQCMSYPSFPRNLKWSFSLDRNSTSLSLDISWDQPEYGKVQFLLLRSSRVTIEGRPMTAAEMLKGNH